MQLRLTHLESYKDSLTQDQWALLRRCLDKGDWSQLVSHTKDTIAHSESFERDFQLYNIYELALEYAISCEAKSFIEDIINHTEVVSHVDHHILLSYSKMLSDSFQEKVIAAMVNHPPQGLSSYFNLERELTAIISSTKKRCENSQFQSFSIPDSDQTFIKHFLRNRNIPLNKKIFSFRSWVYLYWHVAKNCNNNEQFLLDLDQIFYACLPQDSENVFPVLGMLLATYEVGKMEPDYLRRFIDSFLDRYNFDSDTIILLLESDEMSGHLIENIDTLVSRIQPSHPAFVRYDTVRQLVATQPEARAQFIITHHDIITQITKPYSFYNYLRTQFLTAENKKVLLAWYVQHADFKFGAILCMEYRGFGEALAVQYLSATHTALPHEPLKDLTSSRLAPKAKAIDLLITRSDFQLKIDELASSLDRVIQAADIDALTVLLENTNIYEMIKNYYTLNGDGYLSKEDQGTILPTVLAWFVRSDKFEELFSSYSEEQQKTLIKSIVRPGLAPNQPTLHAYVMQSGNKKLIALFGGPQPRLMRQTDGKQYTAFVPDFWRNRKVRSSLQEFQRQTVVKIAKKKSVYFRFDETTIRAVAQSAAAACPIQTFHLLHQTSTANVQTILQTSLLQIRQHIQGHSITGKYSAGLMPPRHGLSVLSLFCFCTKQPWGTELQEGLTLFSRENESPSSSISFNLFQMLSQNPQINFLLIGPSHETPTKRLNIQGFTLESRPLEQEGLWTREVNFKNPTEAMQLIAQILFELVLDKLVSKLSPELQDAVINRLTKPQTPDDYKLARDLIDLLHLEWLVPGDIPLRFSYVDRVQYSEKKYHLVQLRNLVTQNSESDVLRAIGNEESIKYLPFVVTGMINIAIQRGFKEVIRKLTPNIKLIKPEIKTVYYPPEVYQVESLVQLRLEDPNNERTYVTYLNSILTINSVRQLNSNRNCSHHAEMAKLYYALGIGNLAGKNALEIVLPDTLEVPVGERGISTSLAAMRDALLTYEFTTLLVSMQNRRYYQNHNGSFHPITGKGATNGTVALLPDRLFNDDGAYKIHITYDDTGKQLQLTTSRLNTATLISTELQDVLTLSSEKISIKDNVILINIPAAELIAKLRRQAIFYNGINVLTEDGRILLAYRHGKGLASAGGHHCEEYDRTGIAYVLYSEFDLKMRHPRNLQQDVILLNPNKKIGETAIFLVHERDLVLAKTGQRIENFKADPDEFDRGSEEALTLTQMRGKKFYDVMPLESLCLYQLKLLKTHLKESAHHWELAINTEVEISVINNVSYKVPKEHFGQILLRSATPLPDQVSGRFVKLESSDSQYVYLTDESPLVVMNMLSSSSATLRM